jgi:hypothetical protein
MSKSKVNKRIEDFQIGDLVKLNTHEDNPVMSVHVTLNELVYCDFVDEKGRQDRKGFHYKQLNFVEK